MLVLYVLENLMRRFKTSIVFFVLFSAFLEASIDIDEYLKSPRSFRLDNQRWIEYADMALLSERPPVSRLVIYECGMPWQDTNKFMEQHRPEWSLVEGAIPQVKYNLKQTNQLLAAMDKNVREEFLRFTYQWVGPRSILRPEVKERLRISNEQEEKLKAIYYDFFERLHVENRVDSSYGMSRKENDDYRAVSRQIEQIRDQEMLGVLSSPQLSEWFRLLGEEFENLALRRGEAPSIIILE